MASTGHAKLKSPELRSGSTGIQCRRCTQRRISAKTSESRGRLQREKQGRSIQVDNSAAPLLSLPPEIRLPILRSIFREKIIRIHQNCGGDLTGRSGAMASTRRVVRPRCGSFQPPALLLVCRQLYLESRMYLEEATFCLHRVPSMANSKLFGLWSRNFPLKRILGGSNDWQALNGLTYAPGLEKLCLKRWSNVREVQLFVSASWVSAMDYSYLRVACYPWPFTLEVVIVYSLRNWQRCFIVVSNQGRSVTVWEPRKCLKDEPEDQLVARLGFRPTELTVFNTGIPKELRRRLAPVD